MFGITPLGTDCSRNVYPCVGALSTVNRWNHLVVDMNASAMLSRGAAVVGAMGWTQGLSFMPRNENLRLVLSFLTNVQLFVSASAGIRVEY